MGYLLRRQVAKTANMRYSLNVGINKYDRHFYGGNIDLNMCVFDAQRMVDYANEREFLPAMMTDTLATVDNFKRHMKELSGTMVRGDILLLTISSHGTYDDYEVQSMKRKSPKRMTAHCFHDGMLWDFEMREILRKFKAGTKVVKISDCCYAESNWRLVDKPGESRKARYTAKPKAAATPEPTQGDKRNIRCNYFDYAACNIYQEAYEDRRGGAFTTAIIEALTAEPELSYYQLWRRTSSILAGYYPQSPIFENVRSEKLTVTQFLT